MNVRGAALLRAPLLRFTVLGALLFALDLALAPAAAPLAGAPPLDDDALLVAEALARGLHERDDVVRRRLAQNLRFARRAEEPSEAELVEEALRLGMHESDLVVRRRLAQKMRLLLAAPARAVEPSEAELAAYLAEHAVRFTEPARVSLTQLYFRDAAAAEDARTRLAANADTEALGEAIALPRELPSHSEAELAARFGPGFAGSAFAAPDGVWSGPVASAYGHHVILVRARTPARVSELATVRSEVREALLAERAEAAVRRGIAALRAR